MDKWIKGIDVLGDYSTLEVTLLTYVYQCIAHGKTHELEELGVDVEDMKLIRRLPIMDIASARRGRALRLVKQVRLDREVLTSMLAQASRTVEEDNTIDQLVEAGAHWRLVNHFFGTTKEELSIRRKLLDVCLRGRRPNGRRLSRKDKLVVLGLVQEHINCYSPSNRVRPVYQCKALLSTSESTTIPLSSIWETVDAAEQRSEFAWAP